MQKLISDNHTYNRRRLNLTGKVFEALRQDIASGKLRPNQRLVESEIPKSLNVSRTPVREALRQLEITGYVTTLPNVGLAVADFSVRDVRSLFEIRIALETMAIRLACPHITNEQIQKAEDFYRRAVEAIDNGDIEEYILWHRSFHEAMYVSCGNHQLWSLIRIFRYHYFDRLLACQFTRSDWRAQIKQHKAMLEAVRERNAHRAGKVLERSFKSTLKTALKRLAYGDIRR